MKKTKKVTRAKKITLDLVKSLNPCQSRLQNAIDNYPNASFTIAEFLKLDKITHKDKLWIAFRLIPKKNIRFAAGEIAKSVLSIYEKKYPGDNLPRLAIREAMRSKLNKNKCRDAADAADAAYAAAASAAASAASAASAAAYAAAASAYAAAAAYAITAADAAYAAKGSSIEALQLKIIAKYWKKVS